jgi:hypothetical protein
MDTSSPRGDRGPTRSKTPFIIRVKNDKGTDNIVRGTSNFKREDPGRIYGRKKELVTGMACRRNFAGMPTGWRESPIA